MNNREKNRCVSSEIILIYLRNNFRISALLQHDPKQQWFISLNNEYLDTKIRMHEWNFSISFVTKIYLITKLPDSAIKEDLCKFR